MWSTGDDKQTLCLPCHVRHKYDNSLAMNCAVVGLLLLLSRRQISMLSRLQFQPVQSEENGANFPPEQFIMGRSSSFLSE